MATTAHLHCCRAQFPASGVVKKKKTTTKNNNQAENLCWGEGVAHAFAKNAKIRLTHVATVPTLSNWKQCLSRREQGTQSRSTDRLPSTPSNCKGHLDHLQTHCFISEKLKGDNSETLNFIWPQMGTWLNRLQEFLP